MDPYFARLEALKLAVTMNPGYPSHAVIRDAKAFEDYLLGPQPKQETPPADHYPGPYIHPNPNPMQGR